MARAGKSDGSLRRLLSLWEPQEGAGAPVGVLATTFTLDTALFEEECLARFAGVQSDPVRDGALYRIEREQKLSSLICAAVVADVHHCAGRRSLRWDLLAARPSSGVMHAKMSLLAWSDRVRLLVASANLTADGYRRNQECVAALDFDDRLGERGLLDPALAFLREILSTTAGPARARAERLLDWVRDRLPAHAAAGRGIQRRLILLGPGRPTYFDQLAEVLPASPASEAHVVSPFFDPALRDTGPERALWRLLRQRGSATVHFHVAGEPAPETRGWRLAVPRHVLDATPRGRPGTAAFVHPVQVAEVSTDFGRERRPLHAKTLTLSHDSWAALVVGSSNFTSAGTGLSPFARNFEANVVYVLRAGDGDGPRRSLQARALRGGDAVDPGPEIRFDPAFDPEGSEGDAPPPLPAFFAEACARGRTERGRELSLRFVLPEPAGGWRVSCEGAEVTDRQRWLEDGAPGEVRVTLPAGGPLPSVLSVKWGDEGHVADWPVNAQSAEALPTPDELQGLSLAALLDLLSSARPLHEALRAWLRRQPDDDDADVEQAVEIVDPHAKVDTSGFLVKRVQRACWAIRQLRERLEQPVLSESAMVWRIHGPVGAAAVLEAIRRQCDPALPDEWVFLLCELLREMQQVQLSPAGGQAVEGGVRAVLDGFVTTVRGRLAEALAAGSASMRDYVAAATVEAADAPA